MGRPSAHEPSLLFVGALYKNETYLTQAEEKLRFLFGEILLKTPPLPWDYSQYYKDELGLPIKRAFFFFKNKISPETLSDIKLATNDIEQGLSTEGKRNINLDPGYLTPSKVVLASTKNYSHRICLGKGIYAEVTLIYRDGRYRSYLFTYSDYASDVYNEIFEKARKLLRELERPHLPPC